MPEPNPVAVIGAGLAGAVVARALVDAGRPVQVFEKSRGPGGRLATRRASVAGSDMRFDHGAPALHPAHGKALAGLLADAVCAGAAAAWPGADGAIVGVPGMNAIVRHILGATPVTTRAQVTALVPGQSGWTLACKDGATAGPFPVVIVTAPAPQAAGLLAGHRPGIARRAAQTRVTPLWTFMLALSDGVCAARDVLQAADGVDTVIGNCTKPGRDRRTLVAHMTERFSRERLEDDRGTVEGLMRAMLPSGAAVLHLAAHRWQFAHARPRDAATPLFDPDRRLGVAGDWCAPPGGAEGALASAQLCAEAILKTIG